MGNAWRFSLRNHEVGTATPLEHSKAIKKGLCVEHGKPDIAEKTKERSQYQAERDVAGDATEALLSKTRS